MQDSAMSNIFVLIEKGVHQEALPQREDRVSSSPSSSSVNKATLKPKLFREHPGEEGSPYPSASWAMALSIRAMDARHIRYLLLYSSIVPYSIV